MKTRHLLNVLLVLITLTYYANSQRSFIIDYDNNQFSKDGQPYRYISGSMHYFRVPNEYWEDRLTKMKAAGLNAVQTYVAWNVHQPSEDRYIFDGDADLFRFIGLAQNLSLDVILRMGPYICAEFEFGGFPWWLLKVPDIGLRTSDPRFLAFVKKWYDKLLPMLQPYLYKNGGPVISMQIENEYGSRPLCDQNYTTFLRDLFRSYVGDDYVLFTTDGGALGYLKCGYIPGVYPTVDFGPTSQQGVAGSFAAQRAYAPQGPFVNSEFYPGWLDLWGNNHSTVDTLDVVNSMGYMYNMGASFNFYMFEGR